MQKSTSILYFESEGKENLPQVLRAVKRVLKKRPELRELKLIIMTGIGEGPALAYGLLHEYSPRIIAVTFPPDFSVTKDDKIFYPKISERLKAFFSGVGISVVTTRLPFDPIVGAQAHDADMQLIKDVLAIAGGGFSLAVQAILSACDHGEIAIGERVICLTGDTAVLASASTSEKFLSKRDGLIVHEIICKPRNMTISRRKAKPEPTTPRNLPPTEHPADKIIDLAVMPPVKPPAKLKP